jgi:hypothetical protein
MPASLILGPAEIHLFANSNFFGILRVFLRLSKANPLQSDRLDQSFPELISNAAVFKQHFHAVWRSHFI